GPEEPLGATDGEILDDVDDLAPAVIAPARVALGVLVGEDRADRFQHRLGHEVLGGDQLEVAVLALRFGAERLGDLGIDVSELAHPATPDLARDRARRSCRPAGRAGPAGTSPPARSRESRSRPRAR